MKKKVLQVLLGTMMAIMLLSGCGKDKQEDNSNTHIENTEGTQQETNNSSNDSESQTTADTQLPSDAGASEEDIQKEMENMASMYQMEVDKLKELIGEEEKKQIAMDIAVQKAVEFVVDAAVEK